MGNELTTDEVLGLLAGLGQPVTASTWRAYVARGQAPQPVRRVGRTPVWDEHAVRKWAENRPGAGARTDLKRKGVTTTEYGSWNTQSGTGFDTLVEAAAAALGDFAGSYDLEALADDWEAAINRALPEGVSLNGREFYGPYRPGDGAWEGYPTREGNLDLRAVVESVDFWEIAARHDTTS